MKKNIIIGVIIAALLLGIVPIAPLFSQNTTIVSAETKTKKVLSQPLMSLGASLSDEQKTETKRLLGDSHIDDKQVISVDGKTLAKYLDDVDTSANVYSSAFIKPLAQGSGVQVEIVTPEKITKVSSATYQNAAITSGVSDVLIRIASVKEVTGEGALAGVYALLEQEGIKIDKETVQTSQDEIGLIEKIKSETSLSDADANKFLAELKKKITVKVSKKEKISDDWLNEIVNKACETYKVTLSDALKAEIIAWLKSYSTTDSAKSKKTVKQLDQSILTSDWAEILAKLDSILNRDDILALDKMDYSDSKVYHAIIAAIYEQLLSDIKSNKLSSVKVIYSQTFAVEHLLSNLSSKEKEALNYIRTLCYYFIASSEDSKLANALAKDKRPAWLIADNTKANFLNALKRYQNIAQNPNLQELLNRIAIATGYSYEAFLYQNIKQDGDIISLIIVCPCLDNKTKISVTYNLKTGECILKEDKKTSKRKVYDFQKQYKVKVEENYQSLVDSLKSYKLTKKDKSIFNGSNVNEAAHEAYENILVDYLQKVEDSNYKEELGEGLYDPVLVLKNYNDNKVHYAIVDINSNGVDELIVGRKGNAGEGAAYVIYTFDGKQAINLFDNKNPFGLRPGLTIYKDGTLQVNWGSSAWSWSEMTYRIKADNSSLNLLLDYQVEVPGGPDGVTETVYKVDDTSYNETDFWKKNEGYKQYSILLPKGERGTAEKANIELKEAKLAEIQAEKEEDKAVASSKEEVIESKKSKSSKETANSKEIRKTYQNFLVQYIKAIQAGDAANASDFPLVADIIESFKAEVTKHEEKVTYAYVDINDDGIEELLTGTPNGDNGFYLELIVLYDGNKPVVVHKSPMSFFGGSSARGATVIHADGTIVSTAFSSGTGSGTRYIYKIEEGSKSLIEISEEDFQVGTDDSLADKPEMDINWKTAKLDNLLKTTKSTSDSSEEEKTKSNKNESSKINSDLSKEDRESIEELILSGYLYNGEIHDRDEKSYGLIPTILLEPAIHYPSSGKVDSFASLAEVTDAYNSYKSGTYNSDDILKIWQDRYDIEEVDASYSNQNGDVFSQTEYGAKYFKGDQTLVLNYGGFDFSYSVKVLQDNWNIQKDYIEVPIAFQRPGNSNVTTPGQIVRIKLNKKKYNGGSGQKTKYYIDDIKTLFEQKSDGSYVTWSNKQRKKLHEAVQIFGKKNDLTFQMGLTSGFLDSSTLADNQIAIYSDSSDTEPDIKTLGYFETGDKFDYYHIIGYEDSDSSHTIPTRYLFTIHDGKPVLLLNQQSDAGYQIPGTKTNIPTFTLVSDSKLQKEFTKIFSTE